MPFLSLIRFPNLLIIAFTQYMMRYAIIKPVIQSYHFDFQMSGFSFFCLVLSTMCTAAAGYAINDYFDVRTDRINRPDEVVVGRKIGRRKVMMAHVILSFTGVLLGGYVAWKAGVPELVLLFVMVAGMLWFYSSTFKRKFLIGNVVVALFTALVPLMTLLDIFPLNRVYHSELLRPDVNFNLAVFWISGYAAFAFLTTFSREIIKDAEDIEGDSAYGCRSIPIVMGIRTSKYIITGVNTIIMIAVLLAYILFLKDMPDGKTDRVTLIYLLLFIIMPIFHLSMVICKANTDKDYRKASNLLKLVMLSGILYSGVWVYFFK
jgi:4-hydroxybenzoate polyprenyltransferase